MLPQGRKQGFALLNLTIPHLSTVQLCAIVVVTCVIQQMLEETLVRVR